MQPCRPRRAATIGVIQTSPKPIVSIATLGRAKQSCDAMDGALLDYA
jgi:hypothetical protein